jgi:hypothetical protein
MKNTMHPPQKDASLANVISVLYQEKIGRGSLLDRGLSNFIARYRTVLRAAWSENDTFFGQSLRNFIDYFSNEGAQDVLPSALFMVTTLIEAAVCDELTGFDLGNSGWRLFRIASQAPEALQESLEQAYGKFLAAKQSARRGQVEDAGRQQQRGRQDRVSDEPATENLRWYETNPSIARISEFAEEYRETKLLTVANVPNWNDNVYSSVHYEEPTILVIRLASEAKSSEALQDYMEALIARLRGTAKTRLEWQDEYFGEGDEKRFVVGASWDMYPYANSRNGLPGITAWFALDGRAEIIVRTL